MNKNEKSYIWTYARLADDTGLGIVHKGRGAE